MLGVEDHEIIEKIRAEILKQNKTVNAFCKKEQFRAATVQDFLNKNQSIRASTLFKILDALKMTVIKV
ncbi:MAG: hypothetical protein S4CHLAM20_04040 [Chlamydiia bacterium]|nr:hypothetical protein [Chlamydiia bacterium]